MSGGAFLGWRLTPTGATPLGVGTSRLGGDPDLPPDWPWPSRGGRRLSFIAQFDLEAPDILATLGVERSLPSHGLLSFFYDAASQPWGTHGSDRGAWRVERFTGARAHWRRTAHPDAASAPSRPSQAGFMGRLCGPRPTGPARSANPWLFRSHGLTPVVGEDTPTVCLLGGPTSAHDPRRTAAEVARAAAEAGFTSPGPWVRLLAVDSIAEADMCWGENGVLQFWIAAPDLASADFSRVWVWLESA